MKKVEGTRSWLRELNGKNITITDIISFASLAFVAFQNSKRLFYTSERVEDLALKLSLQVLSMEELSKPLIIYDIVPALGESFSLTGDEIEGFINVFYNHPIKQNTLSKYGKTFGLLNYKHKLNNEEIDLLENIKQRGFYVEINNRGEPHIPYNTSNVDKKLFKKITLVLQERIVSLGEIYNHPINALRYYLSHSIQQKRQIRAQWMAFLETADFKDFKTLDQLIDFIEKYEQVPRGGELYVDEEHPDAPTTAMFLLTMLAIKKVTEEVDIIGVRRFDEERIRPLIGKILTFEDLIIKEISKSHLTNDLKRKISYTNQTYKRKHGLLTKIRLFFGGKLMR